MVKDTQKKGCNATGSHVAESNSFNTIKKMNNF